MTEPSKALPNGLIQRLFLRFQAVYGNRLATMFGDSDPREVQAVWADELREAEPDDLRGALDAMRSAYPDYPPTLFQFSALCRDARHRRAQGATKLAGPLVPMPEHIREQLRAFVERTNRSY